MQNEKLFSVQRVACSGYFYFLPAIYYTLHAIRYTLKAFNSRRGFTLLEVMISLVIVAALLTTILYTVNYHADAAYEHTINTRMLLLAKEKLMEMERNPSESKGDIQGTDFTYENLINTTEDTGIVELKTIIRGYGKEVMLSEFILSKQGQK